MRYYDTGAGDPTTALGNILAAHLEGTALGLWVQSGYFGFEALSNLEATIKVIGSTGGRLRFVLGANDGQLTAKDLEGLLALISGMPDAQVRVVRFSNALYHPKTYAFRTPSHDGFAYIGSANCTGRGLGKNVEAGIFLSTADGDPVGPIDDVIIATERWFALAEDGIFPVACQTDIDELLKAKIISKKSTWTAPPKTGKTGAGATGGPKGLGKRPTLVTSLPMAPLAPAPTALQPGSAESWTKVLQSSDAQWVQPGTNVTGKLRLSKAGHAIDHKTYFRDVFFDGLAWRSEKRQGKTYEVADATFDVFVDGAHRGMMQLVVDHAPHRVADQNNVPTVLAWGHDLGQTLQSKSYIGKTVQLERTANGDLILRLG